MNNKTIGQLSAWLNENSNTPAGKLREDAFWSILDSLTVIDYTIKVLTVGEDDAITISGTVNNAEMTFAMGIKDDALFMSANYQEGVIIETAEQADKLIRSAIGALEGGQ